MRPRYLLAISQSFTKNSRTFLYSLDLQLCRPPWTLLLPSENISRRSSPIACELARAKFSNKLLWCGPKETLLTTMNTVTFNKQAFANVVAVPMAARPRSTERAPLRTVLVGGPGPVHSPNKKPRFRGTLYLVGDEGLEPPTSSLSVTRSNQLS